MPRGFKQGVGAKDVGVKEITRAIDRSIDMRLGGEVHDGIWLKVGESGSHGLRLTDVGFKELVVRVVHNLIERGEVASIGQLVGIEDLMASGDEKSDEIGADESGSACDENFQSSE